MKIQVHINFKDYFKLLLLLTYKKISIIIFSGVGILIILMGLFSIVGAFLNHESLKNGFFSLFQGLIFVLLPVFLIYFSAKKQYNSSNFFKETVTYDFSEQSLHIIGQSFSADIQWINFIKVEEVGQWILLYQNNLLMNIIPKNLFKNEDFERFLNIIQKQTHLVIKMKNN